MQNMTVEISSKWVSVIRSPLMWLVWALQGVSVSFAPLFLFWSGKGLFPTWARWPTILTCFAVIWFEGVFFMALANHVIGQLRKEK
jgi:hypothetical protein